MTFWQWLVGLFSSHTTQSQRDIEWLDREEHKQMREVKDRLDRTEQHLWEIDRRKHHPPEGRHTV